MTILRSRLTLLLVGLGLLFALQVVAGFEDVSYPVAELGSCDSKEACFTYCGEPTNYDACISYAEANDLLPEEEIETYRDTQVALEGGGPGGCSDEVSCEGYCSDVTNLEECLAFGSEHGLMSGEELAEGQKVLTALQSGLSLPGGCTDEESCDGYCEELENMQECMDFATAAGMMSEEEAVGARKVLTIMQSGGSPGGCVSKESCDAYCSDPTHSEECIDFAVETGFMTAEEAEKIKAEGGMGDDSFVGPGGCTSEEECMSYCSDPAHFEECAALGGDERAEEGEFKGDEFIDGEFDEGEFIDGEFDEGEFKGDEFEYDEPRDQEMMPQIDKGEDVPREEWMAPPEFEDQNRIDEGFDYDEAPDDRERYEYDGDEYQEIEIYDDHDGSGFEEFDPQDIPLDDALDVNPEPFDPGSGGSEFNPGSGGSEFNGNDQGVGDQGGNEFNDGDQGGGESSGGGDSSGGGADAGLMKSVKRFFSRVVSFLVT
ncbi:MAG: hypothetical protein NUV84_00390 [Candidatus Uhrbacteria bacterium]|nr:hypothetical protein [Candidatus Uhrbacteria bacterium]